MNLFTTLTKRIKDNEKWVIEYFTFTKNQPLSISIFLQTYVQPIENDFMAKIEEMKKYVQTFRVEENNKTFKSRIITNYVLAVKKMKKNKKTLFKISIVLLQSGKKTFIELEKDVREVSNDIIFNIENMAGNTFTLSKRR